MPITSKDPVLSKRLTDEQKALVDLAVRRIGECQDNGMSLNAIGRPIVLTKLRGEGTRTPTAPELSSFSNLEIYSWTDERIVGLAVAILKAHPRAAGHEYRDRVPGKTPAERGFNRCKSALRQLSDQNSFPGKSWMYEVPDVALLAKYGPPEFAAARCCDFLAYLSDLLQDSFHRGEVTGSEYEQLIPIIDDIYDAGMDFCNVTEGYEVKSCKYCIPGYAGYGLAMIACKTNNQKLFDRGIEYIQEAIQSEDYLESRDGHIENGIQLLAFCKGSSVEMKLKNENSLVDALESIESDPNRKHVLVEAIDDVRTEHLAGRPRWKSLLNRLKIEVVASPLFLLAVEFILKSSDR